MYSHTFGQSIENLPFAKWSRHSDFSSLGFPGYGAQFGT